MDDVFVRIKRLVMRRVVLFTTKAEMGMVADGLSREDVYESIWGARGIYKRLRVAHPKTGKKEYLYVIHGLTLA